MRKQIWKRLISGFFAAAMLLSCAAASGAELVDTAPTLTAPEEVVLKEDPKNPGTYVGSFQLVLRSDIDFASTEYGLTCTSGEVELTASPVSVGTISGQVGSSDPVEYGFIQTVRRNTLYFGFFRGENEFRKGTAYHVAEITCKWTSSKDEPSSAVLGLALAKLDYFDAGGVLRTEHINRDGISVRLTKPGRGEASFTTVVRSGEQVHYEVYAKKDVWMMAARYELGQMREIKVIPLASGITGNDLQFQSAQGEIRLFLLDKNTYAPLGCVYKLS